MSYVSTVTIQIWDHGVALEKAIEKLNLYLQENRHLGVKFEKIPYEKSAGTKSAERTLLWGGLNYLDCEEFIQVFLNLDIEEGLLTIANPDGGTYTIIPHTAKIDIYTKGKML